MQRTIELPDDLAARVDEYLAQHEGQTLSSLVQQVLEREVSQQEHSSILDLAELVDETRQDAARRPFGRIVPAKDPEAVLKLIGFVSVEPDESDRDFEDRPEDKLHDWYDGAPG